MTHGPNSSITTMKRNNGLVLAVMLAGALSGLITIFLESTTRAGFFLGGVFGALVGGSLAIISMLPAPRAILFAVAVTIIWPISFFATFGAEVLVGRLGLLTTAETGTMSARGSASPIALVVGGVVGGLLIVLLLRLKKPGLLSRAVLGSVAGGVLALIGWALASSLGDGLFHLARSLGLQPWPNAQGDVQGLGPANVVYSVYLVWQTGMAALIGLMLKDYNDTKGGVD